ncbi:MAG: class I SAM-dependent methyltransferase [Candidatus Accumulibacter sp.]|jgi:SAM-dependent methyltransferase|uniref:class I SAM-dependent methyltransferase n=1 Tax=Accumulibacter sp. TaxID=2053492 RepID=UPI001AD2B92D|nr:class I SAM-dependent methyltransferase [Accumulibacter sp.]MBN8436981.1 class I SAM-dependent methyltransferase [Accumulibacter sp.]
MEQALVKRIHWTPQLVNKFWDGVAQTELDNLSFGKVAGPKFIELISDFLAPGGRHLDFGAGSGHVLQLLLDRGLNAAGFDPSPDRQATLIEKIGAHQNFLGIKGLDCNEQFDVVLLMEVVEHVLDEDFHKVLEKVAKFVKPGGYLIASTPNNENLESSSVYCPVSDMFFHPWQHVRSFTPDQLSDCFKNIGFSASFVALTDFSSDAELVEGYKRTVATASLKEYSLTQLSKVIEVGVQKKYQLRLKELDSIDAILQRGATHGLWRKIKFGFYLLMKHRTLITKLHSLVHDMSYHFDEVTDYTQEQLSQTMALALNGVDYSTHETGGIDLRLGRETTIVYVGKKQ